MIDDSQYLMCFISIHAPRVGSDVDAYHNLYPIHKISIHAPRVGSDGDMVAAVRL